MAPRPVVILSPLVVLALGAGACGDSTMMADAGDVGGGDASDTSVFAPTPPSPPRPPELPSFGACPGGWLARNVGGADVCEPWPAEEGPGCAADEVRFPGDERCHAVGSACPADGWPAGLPTDVTIRYVRVGEAGGDGSRGAPFGAVSDALAVAETTDLIALAPGTYEEQVTLPAGVSLVGACAARTIIEGPPGEISDATVWLASGAALRDVTVTGARPGLRVLDGEARAEDVIVRAAIFGIVGFGDTTLVAERSWIDGTGIGDESEAYGMGVFVDRGARVELRRGLLTRNTAVGVAVNQAGASALLEDVAIREMRLRPGGELGNGVAVSRGAEATMRRVVIERAYTAGVFVQTGGTSTLDTVVIRDIESDTDGGQTGHGLALFTEGRIVAERILLERTTSSAAVSVGFRTELALTDVVIDEVDSQPADLRAGIGVYVDSAPSVALERVLTRGTRGAALGAVGAGTMIQAADLTVLDPLTTEGSPRGVAAAIEVRSGVSLSLSGLRSAGTRGAAVIVTDPDTALTLEDAQITDVSPTDDGLGGRGVSMQLGATFDCTRCEIRESTEVGVMALGPGGAATLRDVRVVATRANPENGAGMGLVAIEGAHVDMERFVVSQHVVAGLQLAIGGRIVARDGVIADNPVGVNAQEGVDPADLSDRVVYVGNGVNLDSAALPVPEGGF